MKSWIVVAMVALVSVGAASMASFVADEPDTEAIMKGLFAGKTGKFKNELKKQVEAAKPDWEKIEKTTKEIKELGVALEKAEPQKGDKESWKKLAGKLGEQTKELHKAAEEKDLAKLKATQKSIDGSCKACHSVHRGK